MYVLMRQSPHQHRLRRGTTAVELALAAPVFFLLLFALIEMTRMAMLQHAITGVAREGCRRASLASTFSAAEVESWMRQQLAPAIRNASDAEVVRITLSPTSLSGITSGTEITTKITVNYAAVSWLTPKYLTTTSLSAVASARRE